VEFGILLGDMPREWGPRKQLDSIFRQAEAAQRNGFTYISIGQHFLYGDLTWLQPVPLLARLSAEVDANTRLVTSIMVAPLYHPVLLAEELATLDVVSEGRFVFGSGIGYRESEFDLFGVPVAGRGRRLEEIVELLRLIWTSDRVDFEGEFFSLSGAEPHIRPWQDPHPPIWLGGRADSGVRRAGRVADAWAIPPETTVDVLEQQLELFFAERAKRGLPRTHQPLRRNIMVAESREAAEREFARSAQGRYVAYAQRDLDVYGSDELQRDFLATVADHAILGSGEEVAAELAAIARRVPVDPIIFKPGWPTLEPEQVVAQIDRIGAGVVAPLRELEPLPLG
jgi:alkanesulfonate monooxygenase SsuD/methylene tetrahydromethanopterin reductase-like flavin-dependent oxidoreductase (luciferase family)